MNRLGLAFVVIVVLLVAVQSVFIVPEYGQAIVVEVGKIKGKAITKPGLYFKVPFVSEVIHFDKRWLEWDGDRNQIPTRDKKYIWMDAYARWRIKDPIEFGTFCKRHYAARFPRVEVPQVMDLLQIILTIAMYGRVGDRQ